MLGTLRFFLAALVALSHIGWIPLGFNPGIAAVVVFYLISGYVVTKLWYRLHSQPSLLRSFYSDRFIRIYPVYFFVLIVGFVVYLMLQPQTHYLSGTPGIVAMVENLIIVPLNYYMFNGSDRFVFIPPAWSLGAEIQFYLLLPLLLRFPRQVFVLSLAVSVVAQLGWIPREWFTYRMLPGVLHVFMAGALLATAQTPGEFRQRGLAIWAVYGVCLIALVAGGELFAHRDPMLYALGMLNISPELLAGLLVGIPAVVMLAPLAGTWWDQRLGDLSYGLFLNHFIVSWCLMAWFGSVNTVAFLIISVLLSVVSWYIVEIPCKNWRYSLRKRNTVAATGSTGDSHSGIN